MYEEFNKISAEKRECIRNAAFAEFAAHGYAHASTNRIVKEAGISKGILFHYFGSKMGLFDYLYEFAIDTMLPILQNDVDFNEPDLIIRLRHVLTVKMHLSEEYPKMSDFLQKASIESPKYVENKINQQNIALVVDAMRNLYAQYDRSKFKEGISPDMAFHVIFWTLNGYTDQLIAQAKATNTPMDYKVAFETADKYLDMLQKVFYTNATLNSNK